MQPETKDIPKCDTPAQEAGFRRRTIATLVLAGVLVTAIGLLRPKTIVGHYPDQFAQIQYSQWNACADMVVAGDSRAHIGVSPGEMAGVLPGLRIRNFAFDGGGFSQDYLQAARDVLDPASRRRAIVLGINPYALTPRSTLNNQYVVCKKLSAQKSMVLVWFGPAIGFLDPVPLDDTWLHRDRPRRVRRYLDDGWVAVTSTVEEIEEAPRVVRGKFDRNRIDPNMVSGLLGFVRRCTNEGISVFAFRPPVARVVCETENAVSGFAEAEFSAALTAAGGTWIDVGLDGYRTYDGGHLMRDSALQLSRTLAKKMRATLPGGSESPSVTTTNAAAGSSPGPR